MYEGSTPENQPRNFELQDTSLNLDRRKLGAASPNTTDGWVLVILRSGVGIPTNASIPAPIGDRLGVRRAFDSTLTGLPPIVHRLLGKARFGVLVGEASELFGRAGGGGRLEARRVARGALPWTTGTSSSPSQAGTLLRRHMAGFYSAVDTWSCGRSIGPFYGQAAGPRALDGEPGDKAE